MSASLIARFGRSVTLKSYAAGSYVNGFWVEGALTTSTITASVQPLTPRETLLLPEGDRQREWLKLYSTYQFKVQKDGTMNQSDRIVVDGKEYFVMKCTDFTSHNSLGIKYYRADICSVNPANS
ncbi:hypothetical protein [Immundisolibacter sp.]